MRIKTSIIVIGLSLANVAFPCGKRVHPVIDDGGDMRTQIRTMIELSPLDPDIHVYIQELIQRRMDQCESSSSSPINPSRIDIDGIQDVESVEIEGCTLTQCSCIEPAQ